MNILQALLLSLVEGLTEFLPISSTGHLIIAGKLLSIPQSEFTKTFDIVIQSGAIAAVTVLYAKRLLHKHPVLMKTLLAFIPTAIGGFLLYPIIKNVLMGNTTIVGTTLIVGGIAMVFLEKIFTRPTARYTLDSIPYANVVAIGCMQCLSFIPGVSRAAATIFGSMSVGLSRQEAVEFSFFLSIPTMAAATGYDLIKHAKDFSSADMTVLLVGLLGSFFTAWLVMQWLLKFIQTNSFRNFAWYRIIMGIVCFFL